MRITSLTLCTCLTGFPLAADPVAFTGAIGPYQIEMELGHDDMQLVGGRYRYAGRDAWLDLTGDAYGRQALRLSEWNEGSETGVFYLEVNSGALTGFWVGAGQDHPVRLKPDGDVTDVFPPEPEGGVNPGKTGQYATYYYWVNDWFAPNYEIGFNGGSANVVEINDDEILVSFQFIVGPTYHIASFRGLAEQVGPDHYVHDKPLFGGSEPCRLEFRFDDAGLSITDMDNGFACQFGARAHANFDLPKTGDIAEFGGDW